MRLAGHDIHQTNCKVELRDKHVYICVRLLRFIFICFVIYFMSFSFDLTTRGPLKLDLFLQ